MPDAILPSGQTVEVKDVKYLKDSQQLRRQSEISARTNHLARILTGKRTRIAEAVEKRSEIIRHKQLGPQLEK